MLVKCSDLIKIYPSPIEGLMFPALRGLNLSVEKGSIVSVIGPSGSGKSTLLKLISAFDTPSSGEIWFNGKLINQFSIEERRKFQQQVGIMHQSPHKNLIWNLNVIQNVMLPMRYSGKYLGKQKEKANELLLKVGLEGKFHRKPFQLSGGEQQRVAIAVALANNPKLLLADEPTGELDSSTTSLVIDYFKRLNKNTGITILVVTHDRRFAKMTDKVYKMLDGRLSAYYTKTETTISLDKDEEIIIVDSEGYLRLPASIISKFEGLSAVKASISDNKIELVPFKEIFSKNT